MNLPIANSLGTWKKRIPMDVYLGIQGYHPTLPPWGAHVALQSVCSGATRRKRWRLSGTNGTNGLIWGTLHGKASRLGWKNTYSNMGGSCTFSLQLIQGNAGDSHWIGKSVEQSDLFPRFLLWYLCHCTLGNMPATAIAKSCFLGEWAWADPSWTSVATADWLCKNSWSNVSWHIFHIISLFAKSSGFLGSCVKKQSTLLSSNGSVRPSNSVTSNSGVCGFTTSSAMACNLDFNLHPSWWAPLMSVSSHWFFGLRSIFQAIL